MIISLVSLLALGAQAIELANLTQILVDYEYKGVWRSNNGQNQFDFLTESEGESFLIFLQQSKNESVNDEFIHQLEFEFLNPKYQENRQVIGLFELENYNANSQTWAGEGILNYTTWYKFRRKGTYRDTCKINYSVRVEFTDQNKQSKDDAKIILNLVSQNSTLCQVNLSGEFTLDRSHYLFRILSYCLLSLLICFIQFVCVTKLCKALLDVDEDAHKISIISAGFVTVQDAYICLQNLYFALINYSFFQYFILPAFFYFMLATTCDMKLIWIIWRYRNFNEMGDQQQLRKAITIFFAQFYFSLIAYFVLMYFFELYDWFICLTGLLMVPQIVHNARIGNNPKFISHYIFGILCPSIVYPIYARGCPSNIKGTEPSITFCLVFVGLYLVQLLILYTQFKLGPRSMIPKCFLPKQYQYNKVLNIQEGEETDECAICLNPIMEDPEGNEQSQGSQKLLIKQVMQTPCNHTFHPSCLKSWIDIKMQCPTCRAPLPPLPQ